MEARKLGKRESNCSLVWGFFWGNENILKLIVVVVVQLPEYIKNIESYALHWVSCIMKYLNKTYKNSIIKYWHFHIKN